MGKIIFEEVEKEIVSVENWIEETKKLQEKYRCKYGNRLFFRGHTCYHWKLQPRIATRIREHKKSLFLHREIELFHRFRRYASNYMPQELTEWKMFFLANHYGLPTRLLDITSNPLVALFFAVNGNHNLKNKKEEKRTIVYEKQNSAIFVFIRTRKESKINPFFEYLDVFEEEKKKKSPFNVKGIRIIYPHHISQRIKVQSGSFLLFGKPNKILESYEYNAKEIVDIERVYKWRIPEIKREPILEELAMLGINQQMLFPDDLNSLAKFLVWRNLKLPLHC